VGPIGTADLPPPAEGLGAELASPLKLRASNPVIGSPADPGSSCRVHGRSSGRRLLGSVRQEVSVLRVVVRNGFSHDMAELSLRDLRTAISWLDDLGSPMPREEQPSTFHH
jgi:hypothetical protein